MRRLFCSSKFSSHVPKNVSDDETTFTVIGSIGLQGIRLVKPTIGETVVLLDWDYWPFNS